MVRQLAWEILRSGNPAPLREVDIAATEVGLDPRDRSLLRRIIGNEVRHRGTLRVIVNEFARGKPKAGIRAHLHVALAQFFWCDRVPPRAAVSEAVDATRRTLGASKTTYVNAVLRNILRARLPGNLDDPRCDIPDSSWHFPDSIFHDPVEHPLLWAEDALSIPSHMMKRWVKRMGSDRALELGRYFLEEPCVSLRVVAGDRETIREELLGIFTKEGEEPPNLRQAAHPSILIAPRGGTEVFNSPAFVEGRITVQGETALRAAELCAAKQGESWLDLCAAPGGKTAVLAATGACVTAVDVSAPKLRRLSETLNRLGLAGSVELVESDGAAFKTGTTFDGVLVDAPCSNTGVLGARPGARWRFGPSSQRDLVELQKRLFDAAAKHIHRGGALVWSTCSLESDENQQQIKQFLEGHPDWELEQSCEHLPGMDGPTDGGFSARLRRR